MRAAPAAGSRRTAGASAADAAGASVAGPACPARHAGSTDVFLEAIAAARSGDVLVIDNTGRMDEGCIGDLVAGEAFVAGLAGIVVWGAHRDSAAIQAIGIPVWSLGTCPNGPLELRTRSAHALEAASLPSRHRHQRRCASSPTPTESS